MTYKYTSSFYYKYSVLCITSISWKRAIFPTQHIIHDLYIDAYSCINVLCITVLYYSSIGA